MAWLRHFRDRLADQLLGLCLRDFHSKGRRNWIRSGIATFTIPMVTDRQAQNYAAICQRTGHDIQEYAAAMVVAKHAAMHAQSTLQRPLPDFQQFADFIHFLCSLLAASLYLRAQQEARTADLFSAALLAP